MLEGLDDKQTTNNDRHHNRALPSPLPFSLSPLSLRAPQRTMASILSRFPASSSSKLALGAAAAAAAAAAAGYALSRSVSTATCAAAAAKRLDPNAFLPFTLASKEKITHDTFRLKFHHDPSVTYAEALPPASCLLARIPSGKTKEDGSPAYFMRPYTATNLPADKGTIELVVKDYEGGKMSSALCALKPGEVCEMKGPIPKVGCLFLCLLVFIRSFFSISHRVLPCPSLLFQNTSSDSDHHEQVEAHRLHRRRDGNHAYVPVRFFFF